MIDGYEDRIDVYKEYIEKLEGLAMIDSGLSRPPLALFVWGDTLRFQGVVEDLNVKYTLFLPDGTPCRCTVNLKIKQSEGVYNKDQAAEATKAEAAAKNKTPT